MKKILNVFKWYYMFNKRLLKRRSFVILLCLIPVIVAGTNMAMTQEKGMMKIALCNCGNDENAKSIIDGLLNKDGIVLYSAYDDCEKAIDAVKSGEVDAAWLFDENFTEKMISYAKEEDDKPFISVFEREKTTPLKLSHIQLFADIYQQLSYVVCEDFICSEVTTPEEFPEERIRQVYTKESNLREIISLEKIGTYADEENSDYLVAAVRGMLAIMITVCGLAAAMYFLDDKRRGKYQWLQEGKRKIPAFALCLSAVTISAVIVCLTFYVSGIWTGFSREIPSMFVFIFAATGFCFVFSQIFEDAGKLGAVIPAILIILLVLSPIFFNWRVLKPVRLLLPIHYYLNSIYDPVYYLYGIIYAVCATFTGIGISKIKGR